MICTLTICTFSSAVCVASPHRRPFLRKTQSVSYKLRSGLPDFRKSRLLGFRKSKTSSEAASVFVFPRRLIALLFHCFLIISRRSRSLQPLNDRAQNAKTPPRRYVGVPVPSAPARLREWSSRFAIQFPVGHHSVPPRSFHLDTPACFPFAVKQKCCSTAREVVEPVNSNLLI